LDTPVIFYYGIAGFRKGNKIKVAIMERIWQEFRLNHKGIESKRLGIFPLQKICKADFLSMETHYTQKRRGN
jgi:hypothetical protein